MAPGLQNDLAVTTIFCGLGAVWPRVVVPTRMLCGRRVVVLFNREPSLGSVQRHFHQQSLITPKIIGDGDHTPRCFGLPAPGCEHAEGLYVSYRVNKTLLDSI